MSIIETTPATTIAFTPEPDDITSSPPPPESTLSPLTDKKIDAIAETLDNHLDELAKFREMARKKLRDAMARTDASDEELSEFYDPQAFQKRQLKNSKSQSNPQLTNSVW